MGPPHVKSSAELIDGGLHSTNDQTRVPDPSVTTIFQSSTMGGESCTIDMLLRFWKTPLQKGHLQRSRTPPDHFEPNGRVSIKELRDQRRVKYLSWEGIEDFEDLCHSFQSEFLAGPEFNERDKMNNRTVTGSFHMGSMILVLRINIYLQLSFEIHNLQLTSFDV
ncbi:hypothetical protein CEXT_698601 [Caerostris extrusa]|uniref:Uncharacterized protein n=1 Tax=Caerostris extrusa TaxID=172846 RepID=A0AAV4SWM3_CAEEX|nr:hypothetical protein CEXT_698601 [Caerostris extrusa]